MDYGAALEMRFGATRRGFESRPLRQYAHRVDGRYLRWGLRSSLTYLGVRSLRCSDPPRSPRVDRCSRRTLRPAHRRPRTVRRAEDVTTPGHTPGHQSLAVETDGGLILLAGQAVYTVEEWRGDPTSSTAGATRPIARRMTVRPSACTPSSRRACTSATTGARGVEPRPDVRGSDPRYPSGAVLGGELAVPCTCNPLQQG